MSEPKTVYGVPVHGSFESIQAVLADWFACHGNHAHHPVLAGFVALCLMKHKRRVGEKRTASVFLIPENIEAFAMIVLSPCWWCARPVSGGIDRADDRDGYTFHNSMPCCKECNIARGRKTPGHFLGVARDITMSPYRPEGYVPHHTFRRSTVPYFGSSVASRHEDKDNDPETCITREHWDLLRSQPCSYCRCPNPNAVDRDDNTLGYTIDNTVPCCQVCNFTKHSSSREDFKERMRRVAEAFSHVPKFKYTGDTYVGNALWKMRPDGDHAYLKLSNCPSGLTPSLRPPLD